MNQTIMNTNTVCAIDILRSLSDRTNTVAAFTNGVRFFAYPVFYYFYYGNANKHSQRFSVA